MGTSIWSLFAHGGPGMNSFAEQAIIGPAAEQAGLPIVFWNEPSRLRPEGPAFEAHHPYLGWLSCLEKAALELAAAHGPINLIAHSFAGGPALELARKWPESIRSLTLIATAFDPWSASLKIMKLAEDDFRRGGDLESARRLAVLRTSTRVLGDEPMVSGLLEALKDSLLFNHYYFSREKMTAAFSALAQVGDQAGADLDSFAGVFRDMHALGMGRNEGSAVSTPVLRLVGGNEEVIDTGAEALLHDRYLTAVQTLIIPRAGHFLHLDRPDAFLEKLSTFLNHISKHDLERRDFSISAATESTIVTASDYC